MRERLHTLAGVYYFCGVGKANWSGQIVMQCFEVAR
jgi:hypothetical protein